MLRELSPAKHESTQQNISGLDIDVAVESESAASELLLQPQLEAKPATAEADEQLKEVQVALPVSETEVAAVESFVMDELV